MISKSISATVSWSWRHALQGLFPLTLPWIPLFLFADHFYDAAPEGSRWHHVIEILLVPAFLFGGVLLSLLLYRLWPGFLRVPGRVPIWFLVTRILANTLIVYVVLTLLTVFVSLLIDPPPWKSDNLQYIPLVFFAVVFYPPLLTPIIALIAIWRSIIRKAGETLY
jgi:hypothetical protein